MNFFVTCMCFISHIRVNGPIIYSFEFKFNFIPDLIPHMKMVKVRTVLLNFKMKEGL